MVNSLYEAVSPDDSARCITREHYQVFRNVGLLGMRLGDHRTRDCDAPNGARNAAIADLLVNTGMRVTEGISILGAELPMVSDLAMRRGVSRMRVASHTAKRRKGRTVLVPHRCLATLRRYEQEDRADVVPKASSSGLYVPGRDWRPIRSMGPRRCGILDGDEAEHPLRRARPAAAPLLVTHLDGRPSEPALLFLNREGGPITSDGVRITFSRASERCERLLGSPFSVSPHSLRHTFAVHMLTVLVREHLKVVDFATLRRRSNDMGPDAFREYAANTLRVLKTLLGDKSVETTHRYLTYVVDVERFVAGAVLAFDREMVDATAIAAAAQTHPLDDPGADGPDADDSDDEEDAARRMLSGDGEPLSRVEDAFAEAAWVGWGRRSARPARPSDIRHPKRPDETW